MTGLNRLLPGSKGAVSEPEEKTEATTETVNVMPKAAESKSGAAGENPTGPIQASSEDQIKAAFKDMQARNRTILNSEAAQAQPKVAQILAFETDLDPETAEKILSAFEAPKAEANLYSAMRDVGNPDLGPGSDAPKAQTRTVIPYGEIYAHRNAEGRKGA